MTRDAKAKTHRRATDQPVTHPGMLRRRGLWVSPLLWQAVAMLASFAISWTMHREGWVPWDEGQLAQSAERVLEGELPHRDFDEMYSGALTYWHALSFLVFGERLVSTHYALLLIGIAFAAAYYRLALRSCSPPLAALVCVVAVGSSVGVWPSGVPTWYLMFCATFATWAMVRYSETQRWRWLLLAGIWCGIAVTIKVTGLYSIAAGLLAITALGSRSERGGDAERGRGGAGEDVHPIHTASSLPPSSLPPSPPRPLAPSQTIPLSPSLHFRRTWRACIAGGLVLCVVLLIRRHFDLPTFVHLGLPPVSTALALLAFDESRYPALRGVSWRLLIQRYGTFLVGVVLPVAVFVLPWVVNGSLAALWHGVFVLPRLRLDLAYEAPPPVMHLIYGLPLVWLAWPGPLWPRQRGVMFPLAFLATLVMVSFLSPPNQLFDVVIGIAAWKAVLPLTAPVLAVCLFFATSLPQERHEWLFILTAMTAFFWLNQYPYTYWGYFLFCTPLVMLYAVTLINRPQPWATLATWLVLLLTGLYSYNRYYEFGAYLTHSGTPRQFLDLPRAGLNVWLVDAEMYRPLVATIQTHAAPGSPILAGPDCPEVYFLSDRKNPTRTIYDIFDTEPNRDLQLLRLIDDHRLGCVVVNLNPAFSAPWSEEFVKEIALRYASSQQMGRFLIFTNYRTVVDEAAP